MDAEDLIHNFNEIIVNPLIALMFGVALAVFLWGVFQYLQGGDSQEARSTGGRHIFWGLVGMMIMISAFGIINIVLGTFGISNPVTKEIIP
ncbi:MAG: hypothetical protein V4664_00570 [Patescibacteria group bacterium]